MNLLHLIPPPLHRALYRVAHRARRAVYWRAGMVVHGSSVVARDQEGRFLLVRHSYGAPVWAFPGGGIRRHETPVVAAMREFREELGCGLTEVRRLAIFKEKLRGATNVAHIFTGVVDCEPRIDMREIVEARFFARDEFPAAISRTVKPRMAAFDAAQAKPPEILKPAKPRARKQLKQR